MNSIKSRQELLEEIEELRRRITELENREETSLLLLQNPNSIIMKIGTEGSVGFVNEFAQYFFDYSEAEFIGENLEQMIFPDIGTSKEDFREFIKDIIEYPDTYRSFESENITKDGTIVWVEWTFRALKDAKGEVCDIVCIGNDITRRKYIEAELKKVSTTDLITGLDTQKNFIEKFELEKYRFSRNGKPFSLILGMIVNYRDCMERFGTECGDALLKHISGIIRESLRKSDVVGRWASEEIILMLPETAAEGGKTAVDKITEKISSSPVIYDTEEIIPSLFFCVACYDHDILLDDIVNRMYQCLDEAESGGESGSRILHFVENGKPDTGE